MEDSIRANLEHGRAEMDLYNQMLNDTVKDTVGNLVRGIATEDTSSLRGLAADDIAAHIARGTLLLC